MNAVCVVCEQLPHGRACPVRGPGWSVPVRVEAMGGPRSLPELPELGPPQRGRRLATAERRQLARRAAELRSEGRVWREVAEALGVSSATARELALLAPV